MLFDGRHDNLVGVEDMKKGFLFTMDAVLALILVMILAAALATQQNALPEKGNVSGALRAQVDDRAAVELYLLYLNHSSESPPVEKEYYECATIYNLDPNNALGTQATLEQKTFCEKI